MRWSLFSTKGFHCVYVCLHVMRWFVLQHYPTPTALFIERDAVEVILKYDYGKDHIWSCILHRNSHIKALLVVQFTLCHLRTHLKI